MAWQLTFPTGAHVNTFVRKHPDVIVPEDGVLDYLVDVEPPNPGRAVRLSHVGPVADQEQ